MKNLPLRLPPAAMGQAAPAARRLRTAVTAPTAPRPRAAVRRVALAAEQAAVRSVTSLSGRLGKPRQAAARREYWLAKDQERAFPGQVLSESLLKR